MSARDAVEGFQRRLDKAIGNRPLAHVAEAAGVSESLLRKYLGRTSKPSLPGLENLVALAEALGVEVGWLATGENEAPEAPRLSTSSPGIPVVGEIPAGALVERYVAEHPEEFVPLDPASLSQQGDILFGLRVTGDSMIGAGILPGDVAICSSYQQPQVGDDVAFYQHETGESTVKRLTALNTRQRYAQLTPIHPTLKPFRVDLRPGDRLVRVLRIWRNVEEPRRNP